MLTFDPRRIADSPPLKTKETEIIACLTEPLGSRKDIFLSVEIKVKSFCYGVGGMFFLIPSSIFSFLFSERKRLVHLFHEVKFKCIQIENEIFYILMPITS